MSVYRPKGSPFYHYDFQIRGHRFFGTTKATDKREAKRLEESEWKKARQIVNEAEKTKAGPFTMDVACGRYWQEVGQHHAGKDTTWTNLERLVGFFGRDKRLAEITGDDVARLVAWRRGQAVTRNRKAKATDPLVSPATVNRSTIEPLKKLMNRAASTWGVKVNQIDWRRHLLAEPEERVRELREDEAERLEAETREDMSPFFNFMDASGLRLRECFIRWPDVHWDRGIIEREGKGGRRVRAIITDRIRAILWPLREHDEEWVFTYVCVRPSKGRKVGLRYPLTYSGVKSYHKRRRKRAKVEDFRLHDYRHNLGTKMLRETGNLKAVQKALNHRSIKTTVRYAHVLDEDLRDAHNRVDESRNKSRNLEPKKKNA